MKTTIYKIIIFDALENESRVDSLIFWDKDAAILEAKRIHEDLDIPSDSVSVYEEEADPQGHFRTTALIATFKN